MSGHKHFKSLSQYAGGATWQRISRNSEAIGWVSIHSQQALVIVHHLRRSSVDKVLCQLQGCHSVLSGVVTPPTLVHLDLPPEIGGRLHLEQLWQVDETEGGRVGGDLLQHHLSQNLQLELLTKLSPVQQWGVDYMRVDQLQRGKRTLTWMNEWMNEQFICVYSVNEHLYNWRKYKRTLAQITVLMFFKTYSTLAQLDNGQQVSLVTVQRCPSSSYLESPEVIIHWVAHQNCIGRQQILKLHLNISQACPDWSQHLRSDTREPGKHRRHDTVVTVGFKELQCVQSGFIGA